MFFLPYVLFQVLKSIGYKGSVIDESIPFNSKHGIIPNLNSRVEGCPGVQFVFYYLLIVVHFVSVVISNYLYFNVLCFLAIS